MAKINITELGQRIKLARHKRGMTQETLGKFVCVSKQLVCSWEQGRSEILTTDMAKVSLILGFDLNWLVLGGDVENSMMTLVNAPTVPLLQAMDVAAVTLGELNLAGTSQRVAVSRRYSERAFCSRMDDDGMDPQLMRGDLFVVDPLVSAEPCSIVAALTASTVGEYRIVVRTVGFPKSTEPNAPFILQPLKLGYPTVSVRKPRHGRILGSVVEVIRQLPTGAR